VSLNNAPKSAMQKGWRRNDDADLNFLLKNRPQVIDIARLFVIR